MIKLASVRAPETRLMRETYCDTLLEMAAQDKRIAVLEADLASPIGTVAFGKAYPERFFDCGVQESNMVGVAAGMSAAGMIPFAHTFAAFAARRCMDQMFVSACYAQLNMKLVGSDPGITALYNGGTHMGLEDMGVLMGIPNITLVEPTDSAMLRSVLHSARDTYGVFYIRMNRKTAVKIYEDGSTFEIGRGVTLREGGDVTIITSGILVDESLRAAEMLAAQKVSARVVNMFTWKPLDTELVARCAAETGAIVVAENHQTGSGLGQCVAAAACASRPVPMGFIGAKNRFGEVGDMHYLLGRFEMRAEDIAAKALETAARK